MLFIFCYSFILIFCVKTTLTVYESQRTTCRNQFTPFTMWVPEFCTFELLVYI